MIIEKITNNKYLVSFEPHLKYPWVFTPIEGYPINEEQSAQIPKDLTLVAKDQVPTKIANLITEIELACSSKNKKSNSSDSIDEIIDSFNSMYEKSFKNSGNVINKELSDHLPNTSRNPNLDTEIVFNGYHNPIKIKYLMINDQDEKTPYTCQKDSGSFFKNEKYYTSETGQLIMIRNEKMGNKVFFITPSKLQDLIHNKILIKETTLPKN